MRRAWCGVVVLLAACGGSSSSRYDVTIDAAPMIAALGAADSDDVDAAVERLVALGAPVVPALESAATREPRAVRLGAVDALAQIEAPAADDALARVATSDDDTEVRATALVKLGERGSPQARPVLEAALADPVAVVSQSAALACGALCTSPAAIDRIVALGLGPIASTDLGRLRGTLVRVLEGSDAKAAAYARATIDARTREILDGSGSIEMRARAALLAADAGATDVEPTLVAAAGTSTDVALRLAAVGWLTRHGSATAVPALGALRQDPVVGPAATQALRFLATQGVDGAKAAVATTPAVPTPAGG